jgi:16S rRNA (guanine527-N7)-methyltransferase
MAMLESILSSGFSALGLPCREEMLSGFRLYYEALEETNKVMNLTAISGEEAVSRLHFLDCAALLTLADFPGKTVADIGTGAGFPGLVLKIACPDIRLTLIDSLDKRIGFLRKTCSALGYEDVRCLHARAEEIAPEDREGSDIVTSRAVADLRVLAELCLPYVKEGGLFIAMKGPEFDEELERAKSTIRLLGGKTEKCALYTIPGTEITHSAILIRKTGRTPAIYPRRWAQIKKSALQ